MDSLRKRAHSIALLVLIVAAVSVATAQPDNLDIVRRKTEAKLREIVSSVNGAMGVVAFDLVRGDRFAMNENLVFPQASSIKIPILMEVARQVNDGKIKFSDLHWLEKKNYVGGSGILFEFAEHSSQISVRDLCSMMIIHSDNMATNMLIDIVGMENVNKTIRSLGLSQTKVQRRMIDQAASGRGDENLSTPAEAGRIMEILYKGEFISRAVCDDILSILKRPKPGAIRSSVPPDVAVAFKPGGLAGVMTEWAIVYLEGNPFVAVIMENYASGDEAEPAAKKIGALLYDYYSRVGSATKHGTYLPQSLIKK